ncbi:MAG: hypothetical protein ACK49H_02700 [Burkholderiales bacterium]
MAVVLEVLEVLEVLRMLVLVAGAVVTESTEEVEALASTMVDSGVGVTVVEVDSATASTVGTAVPAPSVLVEVLVEVLVVGMVVVLLRRLPASSISRVSFSALTVSPPPQA